MNKRIISLPIGVLVGLSLFCAPTYMNKVYNTNIIKTQNKMSLSLNYNNNVKIIKSDGNFNTKDNENVTTKSSINYNLDNLDNTNNLKELTSIELAKMSDACVGVQLKGTYGSSFFVNSNGILITNSHVLKDSPIKDMYVIDNNGKHYDIDSILYNNSKNDIAVVNIKGITSNFIKLGNSDLLQQGQKVFSVGTPNGLLNSFEVGYISGFRGLQVRKEGIRDIQISTPSSGGSSGSAVLNSDGFLISMIYAKVTTGDSFTFAIPSNEILKILDTLNIKNE